MPIYDLLVTDKWSVNRFTIKHHLLDVFVFFGKVFGNNPKSPGLATCCKIQCQPGKLGSPDGIFAGGRCYRIKTHYSKNIPCSHLSAIFVSINTDGLVLEIFRCMFSYKLLRLP